MTASFFLFAVSRGDGATSPCSSMSQIDQIHPWAAHLMSASQWHPHPTAGSLLLGGWRRSTAWDRLHRGQGGNTNASSGAWQGCSALPITGLTQISSQCGEPEREPRAAFDIVMLYALLSIPWQGTQQPGLAASLLAVLERARAVTAADVFGFPLLVTSKCSTLCSACSSAPVTACLGSPVSCQPCRS